MSAESNLQPRSLPAPCPLLTTHYLPITPNLSRRAYPPDSPDLPVIPMLIYELPLTNQSYLLYFIRSRLTALRRCPRHRLPCPGFLSTVPGVEKEYQAIQAHQAKQTFMNSLHESQSRPRPQQLPTPSVLSVAKDLSFRSYAPRATAPHAVCHPLPASHPERSEGSLFRPTLPALPKQNLSCPLNSTIFATISKQMTYNSFRITSFTHPHHVTPLLSHHSEKQGGGG